MSLIKKIVLLIIFSCLSLPIVFARSYKSNRVFSIMLDPAGDAKHTGRKLDDSFERGITLQFAEELKKLLEERHSNIRVILTRFPGETLQPLQNANFANRLDIDFYLSIHFYPEQDVKPKLSLYRFSYNDDFISRTFDLSFYRYDQAHLLNNRKTQSWRDVIKTVLEQNCYKKQFDFNGCFRLPFKPLIGVKAPALAIEASLKNKDDWRHYLEPIAASLSTIITVHA